MAAASVRVWYRVGHPLGPAVWFDEWFPYVIEQLE